MYILIDSVLNLSFGFLALYGLFMHSWFDIASLSKDFALQYGLIGLFLYPFFLEIGATIFSKIYDKDQLDEQYNDFKYKMPIVYHPDYNITACYLEKIHPFDSTKYKKVYDALVQRKLINENQVIQPQVANRKLLGLAHGPLYLWSLCYSIFIVKAIEVPVCFIPSCLLRWRVLKPMMLATYGTVLSCIVALQKGYCFNLSGGYHHASSQRGGGGFCVYADITIAIRYLRKFCGVNKIMIVDTDAHQGNGHERDSIGDTNTFIVDVYNPHIYPGDRTAERAIKQQIHVFRSDSDQSYLNKLNCVEKAIEYFKPEFLIYNAGTDCMARDPLGGLNITHQGIIQRDELIFKNCIENRIPMIMLLSGGYQKTNAPAIADSITNIMTKYILIN